jgi:hypothetical protein
MDIQILEIASSDVVNAAVLGRVAGVENASHLGNSYWSPKSDFSKSLSPGPSLLTAMQAEGDTAVESVVPHCVNVAMSEWHAFVLVVWGPACSCGAVVILSHITGSFLQV